jgi:muramidase (phage lysozyme)
VSRADLREYLDRERNVRAFLKVIRNGEGTSDGDGYRRMFGGELFDSFADHPRKLHTCNTPNGPLSSTAAGAYQFLSRTWDLLVKVYGFPDFSPPCQDEGAVALIVGRKAIDDVIYGDINEAIRKCAKEWASLPGSQYEQPTVALARALDIYTANGGEVLPV